MAIPRRKEFRLERGKGHPPIAVERSLVLISFPFFEKIKRFFPFFNSFLRQWISSIWIKLRWSLAEIFLSLYNHVKRQINASSSLSRFEICSTRIIYSWIVEIKRFACFVRGRIQFVFGRMIIWQMDGEIIYFVLYIYICIFSV